jgi:hypothetical protein
MGYVEKPCACIQPARSVFEWTEEFKENCRRHKNKTDRNMSAEQNNDPGRFRFLTAGFVKDLLAARVRTQQTKKLFPKSISTLNLLSTVKHSIMQLLPRKTANRSTGRTAFTGMNLIRYVKDSIFFRIRLINLQRVNAFSCFARIMTQLH